MEQPEIAKGSQSEFSIQIAFLRKKSKVIQPTKMNYS